MAFLAMAASQVVGSAIGAISSGIAARDARRNAEQLQRELSNLEKNRQAVPDLSSQIQNQYANLQVATQGAQFQAEESDVSLANTLDTLRATGMGAGGATALAQAALRSKREVGQSIERQEAANIQARAAGAAQAQQQRIAQQNFEFGAREARETARLDRVSSQLDQARASEAANRQAMWSSIASGVGALSGAATGLASGEYKFGGGNNKSTTTSGVVTERAIDPNATTSQQVVENLTTKSPIQQQQAMTELPGPNVGQINFNAPQSPSSNQLITPQAYGQTTYGQDGAITGYDTSAGYGFRSQLPVAPGTVRSPFGVFNPYNQAPILGAFGEAYPYLQRASIGGGE